jgi:hypothetical protein
MKVTLGGREVIRLTAGDSIHRNLKLVFCAGGKGWGELVPCEAHEREQDILADHQQSHARHLRCGRRVRLDTPPED